QEALAPPHAAPEIEPLRGNRRIEEPLQRAAPRGLEGGQRIGQLLQPGRRAALRIVEGDLPFLGHFAEVFEQRTADVLRHDLDEARRGNAKSHYRRDAELRRGRRAKPFGIFSATSAPSASLR